MGSGCSEYQQLLSTHSSPSYKAITVSSSASSVFSGTGCSCTMRAAESSSQARTVASSPVPDGHTVSTTAAGDEAVKRSADCAGDRMRALKACVSTACRLAATCAGLASERPVGGATRAGGKQRVVRALKKTR